MADVNVVVLIGRLTRDAELKYTNGGFPVANFAIAINRRRKNGDQWVEEVNYFDVSLFGRSAETLKQYLIKGKQVGIEGELRQDRWEQPDGQMRNKVFIVANSLQLLGGTQNGNGGMSGGGYSANQNFRSGYHNQNRGSYENAAQQHTDYAQEPYVQNEYDASDPGFPSDIPF